jgi:hypothetical protein
MTGRVPGLGKMSMQTPDLVDGKRDQLAGIVTVRTLKL